MTESPGNGGDADAWAALLSVLAHDLTSPLTAIRWQTELMLGTVPMREEEKQKALREVHESVLTGIDIAQTVGRAVQVLRGDYELAPQKFKTHEAVGEVADMLAPQFDRHRVRIEPQFGEVEDMVTDPGLFKLAVWLLLKRALTEAPAGTSVTLALRAGQGDQGATAKVTVDSGVVSGASASPTRHSLNATLVFLRVLMVTATFLSGKVTEEGTQLTLEVPVHTS